MSLKLVSIIVPFFNESTNLRRITDEINNLVERQRGKYNFEIILMDNHSTDGSDAIAKSICDKNSHFKFVRLSRNFGYQASILTGIQESKGDAVVELDCDGEDDPLIIEEFLKKWSEGYQVVYGIRKSRQESFYITAQRKLFYRLINLLSNVKMPVDSGDFRLIDRAVVKHLTAFREQTLYLRGLISYIGYKQTGIPYHRRPRFDGKSKFGWWGAVNFAWQGIAAFSSRPMLIVAYGGVGMAFMSFFVFLMIFATSFSERLFSTTLMISLMAILFFQGVTFICMGIVGSYIGRIFEEVKQRPRSIVELVYTQNPD